MIIKEDKHPPTQFRLLLKELNNEYIIEWIPPFGKGHEVFASRHFHKIEKHYDSFLNKGPRHIRDFQRKRVYQWEKKYIQPHSIELCENKIQLISEHIHSRMSFYSDIEKPKIIIDKTKTYSYYDPKFHLVLLNHTNTLFLLHELAHAYNPYEFDSSHGPSFLGVALELYGTFMNIKNLDSTLDEFRLVKGYPHTNLNKVASSSNLK